VVVIIEINAAPLTAPGQPNQEVMTAMVAPVRPATITSIRCRRMLSGCCPDAASRKLIPNPAILRRVLAQHSYSPQPTNQR
jgi:hypothetical protein